jgi:hypothetical protein
MLFFLVLFGIPALLILTELAWKLLLIPFTTYRPEEDFTNNTMMFIVVSYMSSWLFYRALVVSEKVKPFLNKLSYFWNYELVIRHVCKGCGLEVKVNQYPENE